MGRGQGVLVTVAVPRCVWSVWSQSQLTIVTILSHIRSTVIFYVCVCVCLYVCACTHTCVCTSICACVNTDPGIFLSPDRNKLGYFPRTLPTQITANICQNSLPLPVSDSDCSWLPWPLSRYNTTL